MPGIHRTETKHKPPALQEPGPSLPLGPGGDRPAGTGEGVSYADEWRRRPPARGTG